MKYFLMFIVMTFAFSNLSFAGRSYHKKDTGGKWKKVTKKGKVKDVSKRKAKKLNKKSSGHTTNQGPDANEFEN